MPANRWYQNAASASASTIRIGKRREDAAAQSHRPPGPARGRDQPGDEQQAAGGQVTARSRDAGWTAPSCTSAGTPAGAGTAAVRREIASLSYSARRDQAFPRPIAARSARCAALRWRDGDSRRCTPLPVPCRRRGDRPRCAQLPAGPAFERHPGTRAPSRACWRPPATARAACSRRCAWPRTATTCCSCCTAQLAPTLIAQLSAFVLRADVRFEDRSARVSVAGLIDAEPDAHWSQAAAAAAGLSMLVASPRRILLAGTRVRARCRARRRSAHHTRATGSARASRTASPRSCPRPPRSGFRRC